MQNSSSPRSNHLFPAKRQAALERLAEFEKTASRYSRMRNHVLPDHSNVSRLSPAIRHRLISEEETARYILHRYAFSTVEKFLQEVYWRRYWKDWLELRPQTWRDYCQELSSLEISPQATQAMSGEGPVAVMNHFAHELVETGYLHNHARMWFAAYWIHTLHLPWQIGADFFYRHLLDADPASNTLSWRWVAGLQTLGKSYLARKSNIEKYLHPDLLATHSQGLELLENPQAQKFENSVRYSAVKKEKQLTANLFQSEHRTGFWIHEEDLSPPLPQEGVPVLITLDSPRWQKRGYSKAKQSWLREALTDTASRYSESTLVEGDAIQSLHHWALQNQLSQVVAMRPYVGELKDQLESGDLNKLDITFLDRPEDLVTHAKAKAGFFGFWKSLEKEIRALKEDYPDPELF